MKVKMMTLMLGMAAMLASCSSDNALQVDRNASGLKEVTITASLPDGMKTRAVGTTEDAKVARCYVQMLDAEGNELADGYSTVQKMDESTAGKTYTAKLWMNPMATETYTLLFWADSDDAAAAPTGLTNVAYNNSGEIIAYAGRLDNQGYTDQGIECKLTHVVTRISVKTTTDLSVTNDEQDPYTLTLTVPASYKAYDVLTGVASGTAETDWVYNCPATTVTGAAASAAQEICHFYVMTNEGTQDLVLRYCGELDNPEITLPNAPINPNYHITYQGDVAHAGLKQGNITATIDENWGTSETKEFPEN